MPAEWSIARCLSIEVTQVTVTYPLLISRYICTSLLPFLSHLLCSWPVQVYVCTYLVQVHITVTTLYNIINMISTRTVLERRRQQWLLKPQRLYMYIVLHMYIVVLIFPMSPVWTQVLFPSPFSCMYSPKLYPPHSDANPINPPFS